MFVSGTRTHDYLIWGFEPMIFFFIGNRTHDYVERGFESKRNQCFGKWNRTHAHVKGEELKLYLVEYGN